MVIGILVLILGMSRDGILAVDKSASGFVQAAGAEYTMRYMVPDVPSSS